MAEERIGKWSRITGTDRNALQKRVARMYVEDRMPIREIADTVGRSYGATHRLLVDAEVPFRARGNPAKTGGQGSRRQSRRTVPSAGSDQSESEEPPLCPSSIPGSRAPATSPA